MNQRAGDRWEEQGLRAAVLDGDERAWRVLHDRTFDFVYAYVYCRTGRRADRTEDVVQECWTIAVKRIHRFDPARACFRTWMRGIADNVLRNRRRRWARRDRTELPTGTEAAGGVVRQAEALERNEHIACALTALPERYRHVLKAKYWEGASVAEIAARGGETLKAVESLLSRARSAFRRVYRDLEDSDTPRELD